MSQDVSLYDYCKYYIEAKKLGFKGYNISMEDCGIEY